MTVWDIPLVNALADQIHPAYPETSEVFLDRISLYPFGCRSLWEGADLVGYAIFHPWLRASPPGLDTILGKLPEEPDTLFIHDIAVHPDMRGQGAAQGMVLGIIDRARRLGFPSISGLALRPAVGFWEGLGAIPMAVPSPIRDSVAMEIII